METIIEFSTQLYLKFGGIIFIPLVIFLVVGIGGQFMLYEKCRQPGIASIVPVWNVIAFLKIVGRPWYHSLLVMFPPLVIIATLYFGGYDTLSIVSLSVVGLIWSGFMGKIYIEICNSFGKNKISDYILVILFNGLYVLNLGLSHEAKYKGPVYDQNNKKKETEAQLA